MGLPRIIPTLLVKNNYFYKGEKFKNHKYIGDPINIIKIFNDFLVDEILILDIDARAQNRVINKKFLSEVSRYALMPFTVGGGIKNVDQADMIFSCGSEKISICSGIAENYRIIEQIKDKYGSQSIIACVDVKKNIFGNYNVYENNGNTKLKISLEEHLKNIINAGAGEILLTSIDKEGTKKGPDYNLIEKLVTYSNITNIYSGGVAEYQDMLEIVEKYKISLGIGAEFVFYGPRNGVLVSYLKQEQLEEIFKAFFKEN